MVLINKKQQISENEVSKMVELKTRSITNTEMSAMINPKMISDEKKIKETFKGRKSMLRKSNKKNLSQILL